MNAIVQVIRLGSGGGDPTRVDSGTGGQAAAAGLTSPSARTAPPGWPTGRTCRRRGLLAVLLALASVAGRRRSRAVRYAVPPERG